MNIYIASINDDLNIVRRDFKGRIKVRKSIFISPHVMVDITPTTDHPCGFRRELNGPIVIAKSVLKAT